MEFFVAERRISVFFAELLFALREVYHLFIAFWGNSIPALQADRIFCLGYTRFIVLEFGSLEQRSRSQSRSYTCDFGAKNHTKFHLRLPRENWPKSPDLGKKTVAAEN